MKDTNLKESLRELIRMDSNRLYRLYPDAIENVYRHELSARYVGNYSERPTAFLVTLKGEKRKRRVYALPIGNGSVNYLKIRGEKVYCEVALDMALHRILEQR